MLYEKLLLCLIGGVVTFHLKVGHVLEESFSYLVGALVMSYRRVGHIL